MGGWVKVEIKAISAQPTEVGVGLSWAELGKINIFMDLVCILSPADVMKGKAFHLSFLLHTNGLQQGRNHEI